MDRKRRRIEHLQAITDSFGPPLPALPKNPDAGKSSLEINLPVPGSKLLNIYNLEVNLKIMRTRVWALLPSGEEKQYLYKIFNMGDIGRQMCEGEFESLEAISNVSKSSITPHAFGMVWDNWRCLQCDLEVNLQASIARNGS